jgi:FkbM family methyltransferase
MLAQYIRPALNALTPEHQVIVRIRSGPGSGLLLPIVPRFEKYYWTGTHESHIQEALTTILRPGMRFWDVGAHIGFFSLLASRLVTDTGSVEAFEPFPPNRARLTRSIDLNHASNITVHGLALAGRSQTTTFHVHPSSLMGSLVSTRGTPAMEVPCLTADDALKSIQAPNVIKIDAERLELEILQGADKLLTALRPILLVEATDNSVVEYFHQSLSGYRKDNIGANHWLLEPL